MSFIVFQLVVLSLAISAMSITISKARAGEGLRAWFLRKLPLVGELLQCPYCVSHWLAAAAAFVFMPIHPYPAVQNFIVTMFALVGLSAILMGLAIKLLHMGEHELNELREENEALTEQLIYGKDDHDANQ